MKTTLKVYYTVLFLLFAVISAHSVFALSHGFLSAYTGANPVDISRAVLVEITPPWDTIDSGVAECFVEAVKYAESENALLLYKVNSYGGYLDAAFNIGDAVYYSRIPTMAYIENKALSAGTLVVLPADIIALQRGSIIGAMKPVIVNPVTGEITFVNESKILEPVIGKAKVYAESRNRNSTLVMAFVTEAKVVDSSTAVSQGVGDWEVLSFEDVVSRLYGLVIEKQGIQYQVKVSPGSIEVYSCSIRSRFISLLSNSYLANILLSVGVLATIFSIASGKLAALPLAMALMLLGLIGTGVNPNAISVLFIILGAALLAVELFVLPGFGIVGVSGIVLITLGFALLPMYIPSGVAPREEYLNALRAFIFGTAVTLGTFFGIITFKVIQIKRKKPVIYTPEGKEGVAIDDIKPGSIGYVKVEGEYWRATSSTEIKSGERVVVMAMRPDGILVVKKAQE